MSYLNRLSKRGRRPSRRRSNPMVYGAHPGAGFSHSRGAFGGLYGAHPGAGFSHSRAAFGRLPQGVKLATAVPSGGGRLPPKMDACIEVIRTPDPVKPVRIIWENGEVWGEDYGWALSGRTYTVDGQVYHEIYNTVGAIEGNRDPHIVPICLIEGTFRPIGKTGTPTKTPARPDILAACIEFIPMGNGAFRVVFENGDVWGPELGWVLSGNKVTIDGVVHLEIIHSVGAIEGQPNPKLLPLCIRERAPAPVSVLIPKIPPREPSTPGVFVPPRVPPREPPPGSTFVPPRLPPPATFVPPPVPTRPDPRRPAPSPQPTPPGTFTPPPQGPTAPTPVPVGPCDPCEEYGRVSFIQVPSGSIGPRCE